MIVLFRNIAMTATFKKLSCQETKVCIGPTAVFRAASGQGALCGCWKPASRNVSGGDRSYGCRNRQFLRRAFSDPSDFRVTKRPPGLSTSLPARSLGFDWLTDTTFLPIA